jgi:hypothetical protein
MFGINNEKLIEKLRTEVIPDIMNQDVEDIVKYNLALKYLIDMSDFRQIGCLTGALLTSVGFFTFTNPIVIGACATGAIASGVEWYKSFKDTKNYSKYFKALIIGMELFHDQTPDKIGAILKDITAEDLVDFLEKEGVTNE